jgi:glycosyltransferase involved in cell wall biosynthesis
MRISAWPAFLIGQDNPYTKLLYSSIRARGVQVEDFSPWRALSRRYDVFHLHWPEYYVVHPNPIKAVVGTLVLLSCLSWLRLRGTKVVWTVHNLGSHDYRRPRLERLFWRLFARRIDGFLALTAAGLDQARVHFPTLKSLPGFVIPHGIYRDAYPNEVTRPDARRRLQVGQHQPMILFLGHIAEYKNVPALARAFRMLGDPEARLVIAGRFASEQDATAVRGAADPDQRIQIRSGYVRPEELQLYFNAADLVVLPFRQILNSGSALLALSFETPVLVPALGAMPELQAAFGSDWVRTYDGELTADDLKSALEWARRCQRPEISHASSLSWEEIAKRTLEAYVEIPGRSDLAEAARRNR